MLFLPWWDAEQRKNLYFPQDRIAAELAAGVAPAPATVAPNSALASQVKRKRMARGLVLFDKSTIVKKHTFDFFHLRVTFPDIKASFLRLLLSMFRIRIR
jgi:hypothetical protein